VDLATLALATEIDRFVPDADETWLTSSPKSPAEQLLKQRLRELVGRE
jgi:hypothetical protein